MTIAFNISAYLFFLTIAVKIIIHIHLDSANGYPISVTSFSNWTYLLPYDKEVSSEYLGKKKFCNQVQRLSIYLLLSTILLLIMRTFVIHMFSGKMLELLYENKLM